MSNRIWKLDGGDLALFWKVKRSKLEPLSLLCLSCTIKKRTKKKGKRENVFLEIFPVQTKKIKKLRGKKN